MKHNLIYDKYFGWFHNQYIDIDNDNFLAVVISDKKVEVQVLNWNYEFKYDNPKIDLI